MALFRAFFLTLLTAACLSACASNASSSAYSEKVSRTSSHEREKNAAGFALWLEGVRQEALSRGISAHTIDGAFTGISLNERVIRLDRKQPEKVKSFASYKAGILNKNRIQEGRMLYKLHYPLLKEIADRYQVQPAFIIALWGIETNYGKITGSFNTVESLASLAYEGRRAAFFRGELLNALVMMDKYAISPQDMTGSWAGAMGQTQFMPSSYLKYAVDYDQSGKADIWHSQRDVFSSIANYLHSVGWNPNQGWGRPVSLPQGVDIGAYRKNTLEKTLKEWQIHGVKNSDGSDLPALKLPATLILPDKNSSEAYLVYSNYQTLRDWNKSFYFATAVGLLADAIAHK